MKSSLSPHAADDADARAALWAARLDGSFLSAADQAELETWLNAHPSHRGLLSSYCQFSTDLEQQLPLIAGIKDWSADHAQTAQSSPWLRWPRLAGVVLTMAAAVALAFWVNRPATQFENLASPLGQRQTLVLADGSRVELNAHTSLRVSLDGHERHIRLADGEAFFAVTKDARRPFIVETPAGAIRVTGTQFNVRADPGVPLEVIVQEGSVQVRATPAGHADVTAADAPIVLARGDRLTVGPHGPQVTALTPAALADALAWRQGQIVFAGTPLGEALARFARYHGRGITATPDVAAWKVGARFSLDDLDGFFAGLPEVLPGVEVVRNPNGTVLVTRRAAP